MRNKAFTLIELLVVIAIIGLLSSVVLITSQRGIGSSRDARRVQEMYQVAQSLQMYYTTHDHQYPDVADDDCNLHGVSWDAGNMALGVGDTFVKPIIDENFMGNIVAKEWTSLQDAWGSSCVYRYAKVTDPCDGMCVGVYAILYAACEEGGCPRGERPTCCDGSSWQEGTGVNDPYDIAIFLKQ